jgi:4-hydroxyphenylacetate 3-monooxygenase/4-hydroxybutyryl-CoA dehydratase/vinylacetyl-CoA-Delta-isomerase
MAIGTYEEYEQRLLKMKPNVYLNGQKVDRSGDFLRGGKYVMKMTYDMCHDPEYADVCLANLISPARKSAVGLTFISLRKTC